MFKIFEKKPENVVNNRVSAMSFSEKASGILSEFQKLYRQNIKILISKLNADWKNVRKIEDLGNGLSAYDVDMDYSITITLELIIKNLNNLDRAIEELEQLRDMLNMEAKQLGGSLNIEASLIKSDKPSGFVKCELVFYFRSQDIKEIKNTPEISEQ